MTNAEQALLERVRLQKTRAPVVNHTGFLKRLFLLLGVFFAILSLAAPLMGISIMESVYSQIVNSSILDALGTNAESHVFSFEGFAWVPDFLKIYSIRWILAVGVFGVLVLFSVVFLMLSRKRVEK